MSEDKFRSYINSAPDGVFVTDENGRYLDVNPASTKITGYSKDELLSMSISDLFPPEGVEAGRQHFSKLKETGKADGEFQFITKNEEKRWWSVAGVKLSDTRYLGFTKDITESNIAKELLQHNENLFKTAFYTSPDAININRLKDGLYVDINEGFTLLTGHLRENVIGKTSSEINIWHNPEDRLELIRQLTEKNHCRNLEAKFQRLDGSITTALMSASIIDLKGVPHIISITKDINERKQIDISLRESEQKYRDLTNHIHAGIIIHAPDTSIIYHNETALTLLGLSAEQITGKKAMNPAWCFVNKAGCKMEPEEYPVMQVLASQQSLIDFVVGIDRSSSKDRVWALVNAFPEFDEEQQLSQVVITFVDITDRKRALDELHETNERHSAMIANNGDVIGIMGTDGKMKYKSPNIKRWFGWMPEELVGTDGWDTVHPEDLAKIQKEFQALIAKDDASVTVEYRYRCKDGTYTWIELTAVNRISDSSIHGILLNYHDISDRKRAEKEKEEMQQQLFQSSKLASIGELAAGVAHEINNPLAIINSYGKILSSSLAKMGVHNEDLQSYIKIQKEAVARIINIIDGLRIYARMDADEKEEVFNVNEVTRGSIDLIKNVYQKNDNILIELLVQPEPIHIYGNKGKFQQILMNLLGNAKDAMKASDGGTITIELSKVDQNVRMAVSDQGDGITQENMDKIFDTFFTTKEVGKGTGLGLSIVLSLITELGGKIEVESKEGKGAKFIMTFPGHNRKEVIAVSKEVTTEFRKLNGHILIVDDEEQLRDILKMLLEEFGLTVDEAENGKVALEKIKHNKFDVVMTDMKMPKMSGDKLIEEMAKKGFLEETKAFIVTGGIDHDIFSENSSLGKLQIGVITKPFSEEDIYEKLKECLSSKR